MSDLQRIWKFVGNNWELCGETGGLSGADGKTVLSGTVAPTTEGVEGDFYINTDDNNIYGPKTGESWGSPTSLIGAGTVQSAVGGQEFWLVQEYPILAEIINHPNNFAYDRPGLDPEISVSTIPGAQIPTGATHVLIQHTWGNNVDEQVHPPGPLLGVPLFAIVDSNFPSGYWQPGSRFGKVETWVTLNGNGTIDYYEFTTSGGYPQAPHVITVKGYGKF